MEKLHITFYPDAKKSELESGLISEISWEGLRPFLEKAFVIRNGERLIGITISHNGIKAKFEQSKINI